MRKIIVLISICFLTRAGSAQEVNRFNTIKDLTDSIQTIMKQQHIAGLMLGICTKDSILFSGGFGYADISSKRMVDSNTLFRMGSITKMFVSLGILQLVREGKLNLNDELKKVAPDVPFTNRWEQTYPVRIIHLLEHTSGFDDMQLNRMYTDDTVENRGQQMMLVHKNSMTCRWQPGERFSYSNPNYAILGYIIEKLSGQPYDVYLKKIILDPLGMKSSNFNLRSKIPDRDVKEYIKKGSGPVPVISVTGLSGAPGALWADAADMIRFIQFFLRNGYPLCNDSLITLMETPQSSLAARNGQKNGYALANENINFVFEKYPFNGHNGLTGTCYSGLKYNRALDIGFIISNNSNTPNDRIESLIVEFFTRNIPEKKLKAVNIEPVAIQPFLGRYVFASPRNAISAFKDELMIAPAIKLEGEKLWYKPLTGAATELIQTGENEFAFAGANRPFVKFLKNSEGHPVMMIAGGYFEKQSNFPVMAKRLLVVLALVLMFSSVILWLVSIVGAMFGKVSWKTTGARAVPVLGLAAVIFVFSLMMYVQVNSYLLYRFGTVNDMTLSVFFGGIVFAIASLVTLWQSVNGFRKRGNRNFSVYYFSIAASMFFIMSILMANGWIGLRFWTF